MIKSFSQKSLVVLFVASIAFGGLFMHVSANEPANSNFDTAIELEGYAWSQNIGWISLNCKQPAYSTDDCSSSTYKVSIKPNKKISGYAWSANIGWIKFGGLSGCPSGSCDVFLDITTNEFSGWARALNYGNGWDGWLSLNCLNAQNPCTSSNYKVTAGNGGFGSNSYAWSSNVIGWTNFSLVTFTPPCSIASSCTADWSGKSTTDIWCTRTTFDCATPTNPTYQCSGAPPTCGTISLTGDLVVTPLLVKKGGTVTVSWSGVTGGTTCEVRSSDGGAAYANGVTSRDITLNTTIFTLYCTPTVGPEIEVGTKTVKVLPTIYES